MRRLILLALIVGALVVGSANPAAAHICAALTEAPVGQPTTVALVVAVEARQIPDIEFTLPEGLRLDRVDPKPKWTATRTGSTIRYRGGPAATYSCERFSVGLTPTTKGAFAIGVIQRAADGTVVARSTSDPGQTSHNPYLQQIVYAGVEPPPPPSQGAGTSPLFYVAGGLIVFALGMMLFLFLRNRRLDAREDELQDRVEAFKAQTRDRPPPE